MKAQRAGSRRAGRGDLAAPAAGVAGDIGQAGDERPHQQPCGADEAGEPEGGAPSPPEEDRGDDQGSDEAPRDPPL